MTRYIGVDLHTNCLTACFLNEDGQSEFRSYRLSELDRFKHALQPTDQVAVEATGGSPNGARSWAAPRWSSVR
ncbi:MAG: hypothetical protein HY314_07110 [Acidobacteria bacterium]|nr:hypothetical protein [Acidobacteriota bacterium]